MFTPQAVWAREFLKDRKDPPKAIALAASAQLRLVRWAHRGEHRPLVRRRRQSRRLFHDGLAARLGTSWRWVYDGGGPIRRATSPTPCRKSSIARRAASRPRVRRSAPPPPLTPNEARTTPDDNGRGQSADKTLGWDWKVDAQGARRFRVLLWNGRALRPGALQQHPAAQGAMIELFGSALVTFLVIIDPPGCAPIFASLTAARRRRIAARWRSARR